MGVLLLLAVAAAMYIRHTDEKRINELGSQISELKEQVKLSSVRRSLQRSEVKKPSDSQRLLRK